MFLFLSMIYFSEATVWKRFMAHLLTKIFWVDFQLIIIECFPTEPSEILHEVTLPVQHTLFILTTDERSCAYVFT